MVHTYMQQLTHTFLFDFGGQKLDNNYELERRFARCTSGLISYKKRMTKRVTFAAWKNVIVRYFVWDWWAGNKELW